MAARKYAFKSAQEIINQKQSYVANINMVWDAATEAAEALKPSHNSRVMPCPVCDAPAVVEEVTVCSNCGERVAVART